MFILLQEVTNLGFAVISYTTPIGVLAILHHEHA